MQDCPQGDGSGTLRRPDKIVGEQGFLQTRSRRASSGMRPSGPRAVKVQVPLEETGPVLWKVTTERISKHSMQVRSNAKGNIS